MRHADDRLTFSFGDTQIFLLAPHRHTHTHKHTPPPLTFSDVHKHMSHEPQKLNRWTGEISQAFGRFSWTLSDIRLALYRDTPIPTAAIVMAIGSMRLLCGWIWTSPDICLCGRGGHTGEERLLKYSYSSLSVFLSVTYRDCYSETLKLSVNAPLG